jgi:DNA-binding MurR/RpiR family transcriptional regulator
MKLSFIKWLTLVHCCNFNSEVNKLRGRNGVKSSRDPDFGLHPLNSVLSAINQMPGSYRSVAQYIVDNPQKVASLSISELANVTESNKTTVVRVCQLSGYQGYRELRAALLENRGLVRGAELLGFDVPDDANPDDDILHIAREVIKINLEVLQETLTLLDGVALRSAADRILAARQVFLVGFGSSAPVAQDAYQRFLRLQIPSSACADPHVLASIAANLLPADLLFSVTYSGETRDMIEALETSRSRGATTITLTSVPGSSSARLSDIVLVSAVRRKPLAGETVATRVAQLAVVDVVSAIIALRKKVELRGANERIEKELSKKRVKYPVGNQSRGRNRRLPS